MRFAAVILAAGSSRRMGPTNKLLFELGGAPLACRVLDAVRRSCVQEICVVLGHEGEAVRAVLEAHSGPCVRFVKNVHHREGLSSSLICGLLNLDQEYDGVAVCLGDMPFVEPEIIDTLCAALEPGDYAAVPVWQGTWGNPAVLSPAAARDAMTLTGDRGARVLLRRHAERVREVVARSDAVLRDIDRERDLGLS